jgi:hypothetical protein
VRSTRGVILCRAPVAERRKREMINQVCVQQGFAEPRWLYGPFEQQWHSYVFFHEHLAQGDRGAGDVLSQGLTGPGGSGGVFTEMSKLKPLWVQPGMLLARRSLISERLRKKATMEAR